MRAFWRRAMRFGTCGVGLASLLAASSGCDDNSAENTKVVDAVVESTATLYTTIEGDEASWLTTVDNGTDVLGTLQSPIGGSVEVSGWRVGIEEEAGTGFHSAYGEKLYLNYSNYGAGDVFLSGGIVMTRHSMDFGPAGGTSINDASRTTEYRGTLSVSGGAAGTYTLDIHGVVSGTVEWTCGTVNEDEHGVGACF